MYKQTLETIHSLQLGRLSEIPVKGDRLKLPDVVPTKSDGLYWLYTSYTADELRSATKSEQQNSVDIGRLACAHHGLTHVCSLEIDGFRLVYNGIGGVGPRGAGGLRERLQGELNGGNGTGSLAIRKTSLCDLNKWRFSYVLWSEITLTPAQTYAEACTLVERAWRLHYGWPLLCSH